MAASSLKRQITIRNPQQTTYIDLRWFLFMVIFNTMCLSDLRLTMKDDLDGFDKGKKSRPRENAGA